MNLNEFFRNIPEEFHGNISVGQNEVTVKLPDGKSYTYQLGDKVKDQDIPDPVSGEAKEVIRVDAGILKASLKILSNMPE
jgi:hypothetical protein